MTLGLALAFALVGVVVGAWLELVVARVPEKVAVTAGPTFGPDGIGWRLRPVLLAVVTGAVSSAVAVRFHDTWALPAYLFFGVALVALTAIDLETYLLPNRIVFPLAVAGVALLALAAAIDGTWPAFLRALFGGVVGFGAFAVLFAISPRAMGFGDVKLAFVLGLYLGWLGWGELALGFFLGFLYGALVAVVLIITRVRGRKDHLPFGPYLAAGAITAVLWGAPIIDWYRGT